MHGYADELEALLDKLGYRERMGVRRHPDRQALFVGDLIDRGPKQIEVVGIVRRMVEAGSARMVMGNHEFNAIAWFTPDPDQPGEYLRPHDSLEYGRKNYEQHKSFLDQIKSAEQHREIIEWLFTFPLWIDLPELRVVHACWHPRFIEYLGPRLADGGRLTEELLISASREPDEAREKDTPEPSSFKAVEALLKGLEAPLPAPHSFLDKDGIERRRVRVRWWDREADTYRRAAMLPEGGRQRLPQEQIPAHLRLGYQGDKPVFFGHYWLRGQPAPMSESSACLDYSIAKGGKLVAYRWDGERIIDASKFCWIESAN